MGYHRAGFRVYGMDIIPQPHYPFTFFLKDLKEVSPEWVGQNFDAVHLSPPCKAFSKASACREGLRESHENLIPAARKLAEDSGLPYVIENVPGAPLIDPVMLCGSMWDNCWLRRHRLFELSGFDVPQLPCRHEEQAAKSPGFMVRYRRQNVVSVFGKGACGGRNEADLWREVMECPWMTKMEVAQAIPPFYTEFIGGCLMEGIK